MSLFKNPGAKKRSKAFQKAKQQADDTGHILCGTVSDSGEPIYFNMPPDASQRDVADRAFAARHGRLPNPAERYLLDAAQRRLERARG